MKRYIILPALIVAFLAISYYLDIAVNDLLNIKAILLFLAGISLFLLIGWPLKRIKNTFNAIVDISKNDINDKTKTEKLLIELFTIAKHHRINGALGVENILNKINHPFLRFSAGLLVEGYSENELRTCLESEDLKELLETKANIRLLRSISQLCPALGMAGTIIGLMAAMNHLGDITSLGKDIALALSTTLYGILLSYTIFLPLSKKMEEASEKAQFERSIIIEGLIKMLNGEHPLKIAEALNAYDLYLKVSKKISKDLFNPIETSKDNFDDLDTDNFSIWQILNPNEKEEVIRH